VIGGRVPPKGFALHSERGFEYAIVQDATGKTASEIHDMDDVDRTLTALLRARYYDERNDE
jgi:hypothetical protein